MISGGGGEILALVYAVSSRLARCSRGLSDPRVILMHFSSSSVWLNRHRHRHRHRQQNDSENMLQITAIYDRLSAGVCCCSCAQLSGLSRGMNLNFVIKWHWGGDRLTRRYAFWRKLSSQLPDGLFNAWYLDGCKLLEAAFRRDASAPLDLGKSDNDADRQDKV